MQFIAKFTKTFYSVEINKTVTKFGNWYWFGKQNITLDIIYINHYLEASKPKWVNPILNIIGINSLRLGGLHFRNTTIIYSVHFQEMKLLLHFINKILTKICSFSFFTAHKIRLYDWISLLPILLLLLNLQQHYLRWI